MGETPKKSKKISIAQHHARRLIGHKSSSPHQDEGIPDFEFIRPQYTSKPKYMEIYLCTHCGFDSGLVDTQMDKRCFGCMKGDGLILLHREKLSPEVMAKRMAYSARRMNMALKGAYDLIDKKTFLEVWNSPDLLKPDEDEEKRMLDLLAKGKDVEDNITKIFSEKDKKTQKKKKDIK